MVGTCWQCTQCLPRRDVIFDEPLGDDASAGWRNGWAGVGEELHSEALPEAERGGLDEYEERDDAPDSGIVSSVDDEPSGADMRGCGCFVLFLILGGVVAYLVW